MCRLLKNRKRLRKFKCILLYDVIMHTNAMVEDPVHEISIGEAIQGGDEPMRFN